MNKYFCSCGIGFPKKKWADEHLKNYKEIYRDGSIHLVSKRHFSVSLMQFFLGYPFRRSFRFICIMIIIAIIDNHFKIHIQWWEYIALGFLLPWIID
jgi:hypothetical protein